MLINELKSPLISSSEPKPQQNSRNRRVEASRSRRQQRLSRTAGRLRRRPRPKLSSYKQRIVKRKRNWRQRILSRLVGSRVCCSAMALSNSNF